MKSLFTFVAVFLFNIALVAGDISGFWKILDEKSGRQRCMVAIYPYNGRYYGRIVASFNQSTGQLLETIYAPRDRAPGVRGKPFYCGLDFIWNVQRAGNKFGNGKILDPEHGDVYNVELWTKGNNLVVRGKLLMFGRNMTWVPASESDFAQGFAKPDITKFVPQIPKV